METQQNLMKESLDLKEKLSAHFTLGEMIRSTYATRYGIANVPNEREKQRLKLLCQNILEKVRELFGMPVVVSSGFRNKRVNAGIGGSETSQHPKGEAGDVRVVGFGVKEVVVKIMKSQIPFDQLIYEFGELGWIHISYSDKPRRKVLTAYKVKVGKKTKTKYKTFEESDFA